MLSTIYECCPQPKQNVKISFRCNTVFIFIELSVWKNCIMNVVRFTSFHEFHYFRTPYLALAKTMELIESTSGRLKTIEMLANFFRSVIVLSPDDLLQCVYLCLNKVAPAFEGLLKLIVLKFA